jgi:LPXTG-motif cell wall-anchored protein
VVAEPVAAVNTQGTVGQSTLGQSGRSGLASTGAEPRGFLIVGAVLFGVGAGLVVLNRRRLARFGGRGDRR